MDLANHRYLEARREELLTRAYDAYWNEGTAACAAIEMELAAVERSLGLRPTAVF